MTKAKWCRRILLRPGLAREITLALFLKAVLLFVIWLGFFSHPVDHESIAREFASRLSHPPNAVSTAPH